MDTDHDNPITSKAVAPQTPIKQESQPGNQHSRDTLDTDDAPPAGTPDGPGHEGTPNSKMGPLYVPSPDEDHATKAHDIGTRTDHSAEGTSGQPATPDAPPTSPPASASTNPLQPADKK